MLALWKSNAAPPCSGPLIANATCCSLAAVFFPSCLAWNAREVVSWLFIEKRFVRAWRKMHLSKEQTEQEHPEWLGADVLPSHLIWRPWTAAILPGTLEVVVEGRACPSDPILNHQPSQLSAACLSSTQQWLEASGRRLRGPGEEAPLICKSQIHRHSGERCFVSPHCLHTWFLRLQTQHSGRPLCYAAQCLRICLHFLKVFAGPWWLTKHISESEIFMYILNPKHRWKEKVQCFCRIGETL